MIKKTIMNQRGSSVSCMGIFYILFCTQMTLVQGVLNECLGVEMNRLSELETCSVLFDASQIGVQKLNEQLHVPSTFAYKPVSVISASESRETIGKTSTTLFALLLQVAPLDQACMTAVTASKSPSTNKGAIATITKDSCPFDMSKVDVYSLIVVLDQSFMWTLKGYKHHGISEGERAQIEQEYKSGKFYGSKLALGIFDAPALPMEDTTNSSSKQNSFARSPLGFFVVVAGAFVSVGLLFHHRRRLHNGYAPIVIVKRGSASTSSGAGGNVQGTLRPPNSTSSLRHSNPIPTNEDHSLHGSIEHNERFAV